MNYGIPYMGSKSKICEAVCRLFPKADHFYDLFGGGFSVTHFMLKHRSKDFKEFHFNEIRPGICEMIKDAIAGKYNYDVFKPKWVSREDFFRLKESDPYIKIIWSFGNNGKTYLFNPDLEREKKSLHQAIVFNEFDEFAKEIFGVDRFAEGFGINEKRLYLKNRLRLLSKDRCDLQQLQQLQQLHFYCGSYDQVKIKPNSIIYCDPPYIGTADYDKNKSFDHKKFLDWSDAQTEPVFISEYQVNDSRFKCIANLEKRSLLNKDKSKNLIKTEKVFVNKAGYKRVLDMISENRRSRLKHEKPTRDYFPPNSLAPNTTR